MAGVIAVAMTHVAAANSTATAVDGSRAEGKTSSFVACTEADMFGTRGKAIYRDHEGNFFLVSKDTHCSRGSSERHI
jgi:hypothetical protein